MLPSFLVSACFWDVDLGTVDLRAHQRFIIERVMEYGGDEAIRWLLRTYEPEELAVVLRRSGNLSAKTVVCWANYLGLSEEGESCIPKYCRPEEKTSFPP